MSVRDGQIDFFLKMLTAAVRSLPLKLSPLFLKQSIFYIIFNPAPSPEKPGSFVWKLLTGQGNRTTGIEGSPMHYYEQETLLAR